MEEPRLLAPALGLSASRVVGAVLSVARGVVLARLLGPANYGIVSAIHLIGSYAGVAQVGLTNAVGLEVPSETARGHPERARQVERTALTASAGLSAAWALAVWLVGGEWLGATGGVAPAVAATLFALLGATAMLEAILYARGAFSLLAWVPLADTIVRTIVMVGAVFIGGLDAVLLALPVLQLAVVGYYVWSGRLDLRPAIDLAELRRLVVLGLPLFVGGFFFGRSGRLTTGSPSGSSRAKTGATTAWRFSWATSC